MASIITATTSSGLTQSADNSGVLQLASGTGNLVTVPSVTGTAMVSGNMPAFSAYLAGTQSISANTTTKVTFDTEEFDTNNNFASSRFTPTVAGYYQVSAALGGVSNANAILINFYKNGSSYKRCYNGGSNAVNLAGGSCLVYCNGSTDYIEVYTFISGSVTLNTGADSIWFQGSMVRAA